jgi:hypothetical protein
VIRDADAQVVYDRTEGGIVVPGGNQVTHVFGADWRPQATGRCSIEVRTIYAGDAYAGNDRLRGIVRVTGFVPSGWTQQANLPQGMMGKNVKDGGALTYSTMPGNDSGFVYAFKGNNTNEFYRYNIMSNSWLTLDTIPFFNRSMKRKGVKKGATLAAGPGGKIYAAKGNSTLDWWEYAPGTGGRGVWTQKADVPAGAKNVKEGCGSASVRLGGVDYIYLLKGSGTYEFYRYDAAADAWVTMPGAPLGGGRPYKTGSALTSDGTNMVWALKGTYHEFFGFDVAGQSWTTRENLPFGFSRKKAKDGAGLAHDEDNLYCLKGGNTNELWVFETAANRWWLGDPMGVSPAGRRVKNGGALAAATGRSALYAFRGNNTLEFWSYGVPILDEEPVLAKAPGGVQNGGAPAIAEFGLRISPNPVAASPNPSVSYFLPMSGNVALKLYDISGKLVSTFVDGHCSAGSYSYSLLSTHRSLAAGVYLLELQACGLRLNRKLVIE